MLSLIVSALAMVMHTAPSTVDALPVAELITADVLANGSPFPGDASGVTMCAAFVVTFERESHFDNTLRGDSGRSCCMGQIWVGKGRTKEGYSCKDLEEDPAKCVTVTGRKLRESITSKYGSKWPFAIYVSGKYSETAKRISNDRMREVEQLTRDFAEDPIRCAEGTPERCLTTLMTTVKPALPDAAWPLRPYLEAA